MKLHYNVVEERQEGGHLCKVFFSFNKAIEYALFNKFKEIEICQKGYIGYTIIGKVILN
jgi:hypothetical protein